jgi:membrane-bound inhibitor of C-type lysozyme
MKKLTGIHWVLPVAVALTVLTGCMAKEQKNRWSYVCSDGYSFAATFARDGDSVIVDANDEQLKLKQVRAASGARYSDGDAEFWTKGIMARLQLLDENSEAVIYENCQGDNS